MQIPRLPSRIKEYKKSVEGRVKELQAAFDTMLHKVSICPISVGYSGVKGHTLTVYYKDRHYYVYEMFHGDTIDIPQFIGELFKLYDERGYA